MHESEAAGSRWVCSALNCIHDALASHAPAGAFAHLAQKPCGLSPTDILHLLDASTFNHRLTGIVAGSLITDDAAMVCAFGRRLRRAVVVRHPVLRADSLTLVRLKQKGEAVALPLAVRATILRSGTSTDLASLTAEQRAFALACWTISAVEKTSEAADIKHFRFEDLVTDIDADRALLAHLSAGSMTDWEGEARGRLEALRGIRVGKHTGERRAGPAVYKGWPEWKTTLFAVLLSERAFAWHAQAGYDLDGVTNQGLPYLPREGVREALLAEKQREIESINDGPVLLVGLGDVFDELQRRGVIAELRSCGVTVDAADDDPSRVSRAAPHVDNARPLQGCDVSVYRHTIITALFEAEAALRADVVAAQPTSA
ncbi:MAG: hypothetical protein KAS72_10835 [Phycisphaerales bacterium]|nr:hypothetical protein [Phycisphaerales bacterium]